VHAALAHTAPEPRSAGGSQLTVALILFEIDVGEHLAVGVADDVRRLLQQDVGFVDGPGRREAAGHGENDEAGNATGI
jgi:hypothetical protein